MFHYHKLSEFKHSLDYKGKIIAWNKPGFIFVLNKSKGLKLGVFPNATEARAFADRTENLYNPMIRR